MAENDYAEVTMDIHEIAKKVLEGHGTPNTFAAHDLGKRLYRAGYRRTAAQEGVGKCRRCGREPRILSQAVCIDCAGKPSRPEGT